MSKHVIRVCNSFGDRSGIHTILHIKLRSDELVGKYQARVRRLSRARVRVK